MALIAPKPSCGFDSDQAEVPRPGIFNTTHWSVVLKAGNSSAPEADAALAKLCRNYWSPLYFYVRREGFNPHDAQDLIQGFFARVIEKKYFGQADRERGKFRSFLLAALKHFISDEHKKSRAQKRGGGKFPVSLDAERAEQTYCFEPATDLDPEKLYNHRWALTVMEQTVARLAEEYRVSGRGWLFDELKQFQAGEQTETSYAEAATRLALSESAVKSAIHRMRQRHAELLREEVAQIVATAAEVDEEIRHFITVFSG